MEPQACPATTSRSASCRDARCARRASRSGSTAGRRPAGSAVRRSPAPRLRARRRQHVPFCITSAYGRPVSSMWAVARSSAGPIASVSVGNSSQGICIVSSIVGVIGPISACCGSSGTPGWARQVTISSCGRRNVQVSEVKRTDRIAQAGVLHHGDAAPATATRPDSATPAISATASPFVRHRYVAAARDPAARS